MSSFTTQEGEATGIMRDAKYFKNLPTYSLCSCVGPVETSASQRAYEATPKFSREVSERLFSYVDERGADQLKG